MNIYDLQFALDIGIISNEDMRTKIIMSKRDEAKKLHKYAITAPSKKGGRYSTYVPDPDAPGGRRKIRKTKLEDLLDVLVKIYIDKEDTKKPLTIADIYPDWLKHKRIVTTSEGTIKRHDQHYRKYYANSSIVSIPLVKLSEKTVQEWIHTTIREYNLTKKELNNMKIILTGCLDYAIDMNIIQKNPYRCDKINTKLCRTVNKKENTTQVFLDTELSAFKQYLLSEYNNNPNCTDPLAILLNFLLGLRIGELVALKWSDINNGYLNVQRMEIRKETMNDDLTWNTSTRVIVGHTKANREENDNRLIYLTKEAKKLLKMVKECNEQNHFKDDDFIFVNEQGRRKSTAIAYKLKKYCENSDIPAKSSHKIRKTVASLLDANGMPLDEIRKMLGHSSEKTTLGYIYNPYCDEVTEELYEKSLTLGI